MSEWEPLCEPGGSGGGLRAEWQHLTIGGGVTFCGKTIDVTRWKRWGLTYPTDQLSRLVPDRLCAECQRGALRFEAGRMGA